MTPKELLYEGKAKRVFKDDDSKMLILEFKDSLTAFNAQKKGSFDGKGAVNSEITEIIFNHLSKSGIKSHFVNRIDGHHLRVLKVDMIPLEVVVRNVMAGSLAKKLGRTEGDVLPFPVVEYYYKKDELEDPLLVEDHVKALGLADDARLSEMRKLALDINSKLKELFFAMGLTLVDFKVEMGLTPENKLVLADEITPDSCRLWDIKSGEKMDKDRFRRDLGNVKESYGEVLSRLKTAVKI
ncbi:MAG: phosphoribosylaminoimidazolesuccinocarboxamide synthase [Bdellovibrionota bacterium]